MDLTFIYTPLYIIIVGIVCLKILWDTETPSKALAYIALVIFFPIIGIIFYFAVGANYRKKRIYSKKLTLDEKAYPELDQNIRKYSKEAVKAKLPELKNFVKLAESLSSFNLTSENNTVELLTNGNNKFPELLKCLKQAKHHIHLEYYIYDSDDIGNEVGDILVQKAQEGVKVRFIYDDFGSKALKKKFIKRLKDAGVEVYPFMKLTFLSIATRLNYRNHRKIVVIDGLTGFVGGINVSDRYINNGKYKLYWRDTHVKITGISVINLQHIFLTDWNFCAKQCIPFSEDYFPIEKRNESFGDEMVQIADSGPDSKQPAVLYNLIQAALLANKEFYITTPYFIPEKSFIDALKIAKYSGVDVKIIIPKHSDSAFVNAAANSYLGELLDVGIEIYQYKPGFIHAKTTVCDQFVSIIGTANLDVRSFDLNFEVNSITYSERFAKKVRDQFLKDLEESDLIDPEAWKNRPFFTRLFEKVAHLFSPLL